MKKHRLIVLALFTAAALLATPALSQNAAEEVAERIRESYEVQRSGQFDPNYSSKKGTLNFWSSGGLLQETSPDPPDEVLTSNLYPKHINVIVEGQCGSGLLLCRRNDGATRRGRDHHQLPHAGHGILDQRRRQVGRTRRPLLAASRRPWYDAGDAVAAHRRANQRGIAASGSCLAADRHAGGDERRRSRPLSLDRQRSGRQSRERTARCPGWREDPRASNGSSHRRDAGIKPPPGGHRVPRTASPTTSATGQERGDVVQG